MTKGRVMATACQYASFSPVSRFAFHKVAKSPSPGSKSCLQANQGNFQLTVHFTKRIYPIRERQRQSVYLGATRKSILSWKEKGEFTILPPIPWWSQPIVKAYVLQIHTLLDYRTTISDLQNLEVTQILTNNWINAVGFASLLSLNFCQAFLLFSEIRLWFRYFSLSKTFHITPPCRRVFCLCVTFIV